MIIDLKDLGVRCYTYASSLFDMLHACAAQNVPVLVLDRSTPLADMRDGPLLEPGHESFVGRVPSPLVYGLSQGPLASFLQSTLPALCHLDLTVVPPMESETVSWIPPSPAIVSELSALCYPITVWSEAIPDFWVDRGGPASFQVWAMPDLPVDDLCALTLPGVTLHPDQFQTPKGIWPGVRFELSSRTAFKPVTVAHHLLAYLSEVWGADRLFDHPDARPDFFDQLAGGPSWRLSLLSGTVPAFL